LKADVFAIDVELQVQRLLTDFDGYGMFTFFTFTVTLAWLSERRAFRSAYCHEMRVRFL